MNKLQDFAGVIACHEQTEDICEAVVQQEKKRILESMRHEVMQGNFHEATLLEGQILGLQSFFKALRRFAKNQ